MNSLDPTLFVCFLLFERPVQSVSLGNSEVLLPRDTDGTSRQEGVGGGGAVLLPGPGHTLPLPSLGGQPELHLGPDL